LPVSPDRRELSFDLVADEYERTRPDYPGALLDALPLDTDASVVDLGAGTGKLTRVLARRYANVFAVEPLANMRAQLERVVPGATALAGSAERIPLDDNSVDGAFAAQAFHWFDKSLAIPEIARVLRPGGVLAVIWNDGNYELPNPLPEAYLSELNALRDAVPQPWLDEGKWEDMLLDSGLYVEAHERIAIPHEHILDRAGLLDNARSTSWIASRADAEAVIARIAELLPEGTYSIPNHANMFWVTAR
jgi:SAM-dependent methyltransferase